MKMEKWITRQSNSERNLLKRLCMAGRCAMAKKMNGKNGKNTPRKIEIMMMAP